MTEQSTLPSASGEVAFLEERFVTPSRKVAVLESLRDPHSVIGEELRLLRAKVQGICQQRGIKCLALSSALPGEGKSTISLGLATALARERGRRVLLVEADVRRPSVSATLGLAPAPGLTEWLNGALDRAPVRLVDKGGFHLLVAGQAPMEQPEGIASPLMEALLRSARVSFDFVLLDAPPVLAVADTILMQDLVDGFLLVVRSRLTPRQAILDALGRLRADKVIGVVLNDHQEYRHSYTAHAYERYGMAHGRRSSEEPGRGPSR